MICSTFPWVSHFWAPVPLEGKDFSFHALSFPGPGQCLLREQAVKVLTDEQDQEEKSCVLAVERPLLGSRAAAGVLPTCPAGRVHFF